MSRTVIQIITRSMRLAGVIGKGETPDDDEAQDGLIAFQDMIESWNIERLNIPYMVEETLTLSASQQTYTMGPSGDLNTTRPTRIDDSCFIRFASIDFGLTLIDQQAWNAIPAKTVQSNVPQYLFPDMQYPLVYLNFYEYPTTSGAVAHIMSWKQLQAVTTLTEALTLAPGYNRAITYNLALEYAGPEFGVTVPEDVKRIATKSLANIKRINSPQNVMRSEVGYMNRMRFSDNIYRG